MGKKKKVKDTLHLWYVAIYSFTSPFDVLFVLTDVAFVITHTHTHSLIFFVLLDRQIDRMCILTLCSLRSLMLSDFFFSFGGKWWHTIKVIAICYAAHLGQLGETYYVLSVFWGHGDTIPQGLAISLTMNSSNSHKCLSWSAVATRQPWHELKRD